MNRIVKLLAFMSILTGFVCCSKDTMENPDSVVPEGYIRAALDLKVTEPDSINTRATPAEENAYDESNVWVLLFNATSGVNGTPTTLVQAPVKATKSGSTLYVLLRATTRPVTLYVVAGLSTALNTYMATASNFSEEVTDFSTINAQLQTVAATATGVPIGAGSYFHLSSNPVFHPTGTIPIASITEPLIRNVAKIDVDASSINTSEFQLEGVTLVNGAQKGFVLRQAAIPPNHGGNVRYNEKTAVAGNMITSGIYVYENAGFLSGTTPNPTTLIVRGKFRGGESGYYRMDVLKKNEDGSYTPYSIERNTCYTLKIQKVETVGYRTIDEAIAREPSNAEYQVIVNDPDSHDIVSNGHYYMGVSNSEFIVYGDPGQIENLLITTVTTDAPAGTYTSISASAGLSAVTSSLTTPTGTATVTKIYATLSAVTDDYIDLRVGNLTKRITVRRKGSIHYESDQKTDFADSKYVFGEVVSGKEWVRLATASDADFNTSPVSLTDPNGGIYVRYNSTLTMNASRSAELYAHKTNDQGRAKMLLFASTITVVNSNLPDIIDKTGADIHGSTTFTATFSNPGGYPFAAGITTREAPVTVLTETATGTTITRSFNLTDAAVTGSEMLPRGLTLKCKANGVWLETRRNIQQRVFFNVRILSVGPHALGINNGSKTNFGTQLGSGVPMDNGNTTSILSKMLYLHTGPGKPIENGFELFNLTEVNITKINNIGQILRDNAIDILFINIWEDRDGTAMSSAQVTEILNWLDGNPNRGLVYITDYVEYQLLSSALFGVPHAASSGAAPYLKLPQSDPYYEHPVYKAIMNGSYSTLPSIHPANPIDLRETDFSNFPNNRYGSVPLQNVNAAGFIPIFYVRIDNVDQVLFMVHPERHIMMIGDCNWFNQMLNSNASLDSHFNANGGNGNYPKLIMNTWEWYINNVALGKGQ